MLHHAWDPVQEATRRAVRAPLDRARPTSASILGGPDLGALASEIAADVAIPYDAIPHFPASTVESHAGRLVCGTLAGKTVVAMEGRFHLYEGYTPAQVTFPIRVLKELGCETLIVSNAAGGMNPLHATGDLMVIDDHINLLNLNPLIGPNDERLGPRFPDLIEPFSTTVRTSCSRWHCGDGPRRTDRRLHRGVYVGVVGPNLETRAEYRLLRQMGADVVGMSTVPEVIVAVHAGMKVLGFSIITDLCMPDSLQPVKIEDILAVAKQAEGKLRTIVCRLLERLPE